MKRLNALFTATSAVVLLVTIERFSFTTEVLLQPHNFIRLHEIVQMTILILMTVVIPAFLFKLLSHDFEDMKSHKAQWMALIFVVGVYFYATGNGLHEMAGFLWSEYCTPATANTPSCQSMYINNFYTGNIYYFVGAMIMNFSLILLELNKPLKPGTRKDYVILFINSLIYAVAVVAYAAIDPVIVGLIFVCITMVSVNIILFFSRYKPHQLPFTLYCALAYTVGSLISLVVRYGFL